jgi:hypothetical protein
MRPARFLPFLLTLGLLSCQTAAPPYPPNAPATLDGYKKVVEDRLGPIWHQAIAADPAVTLGTVKVTFEIPAAGGRPRNLKTVSNTAGPVDERIARHAIEDLRVPPIPRAVLEKLQAGEPLVLDESFTVFQNR